MWKALFFAEKKTEWCKCPACQKFVWPIYPIGPKVWNVVEKIIHCQILEAFFSGISMTLSNDKINLPCTGSEEKAEYRRKMFKVSRRAQVHTSIHV